MFVNRGFHVAHLNIRSIFPKIDIFRHYLTLNTGIHVIGISETWLNENLPTDLLSIAGYNFLRNDRNWNRDNNNNTPQKGGGVGLYLKQDLDYDANVYAIYNRSCKDIECQWVYIKNKYTKDYIILNLYRPLAGDIENFLDILETSLSALDLDKNDIFMMGDFNINISNTTCGNARLLKSQMKTFGLNQLIKEPTRISKHSATCIDLIFSNCDFITDSGTFPINISDHDLVFCTKKRTTVTRPKTEFIGRSYRNFDSDVFVHLLNNCDWEKFDNSRNLDDLWNLFLLNVKTAIDRICPLKHFKIKTILEPWITNELLEEIKDKDLALKRAKRTKRDDHWNEARILRNRCLNNIRKAKADFVREKLEENRNDSKKFWNSINSLLPGKNKTSQGIFLNDENQEEIIRDKIPDYMNDYFSNIGANLAKKFTNDERVVRDTVVDVNKQHYALPDFIASEIELLKLIQDINVNKSSAIENLSSKVLKEAFFAQTHRLQTNFNLSFSEGYIPESWKSATIVPLHKGGDSKDVNNFRPVSLLPIQGKLIEKIVHQRMMAHFENNSLLDQRQGGFRKNHSTTDTTIKFVNDIYEALNLGQITIAVFIDLRKAFDTVIHIILSKNLKLLGIKNKNLDWVKNYLENRSQKTLVNGINSSSLPVSCGVPQGSVLGPLLFLVYINDMSKSLKLSKYCLYADDTVLYHTGDNIEEIRDNLQEDLDQYSSWCSKNFLSLNVKKTKFVIFGTRQRTKNIDHVDLKMNGISIYKEPYYKYLGILLYSGLNYKQHVDQCVNIVSHKIYVLSKIRRFIDEKTSIFIYKSMIAPIIDYGDVVYMGGMSSNLSRLQKLQNRALRICLDVHHYLPTILLHQQAEIPNLCTRRSCNIKKYMFRQKNNMDLVKIPTVNTRRNDAIIFKTVRPNLEKFKNNPLYTGALIRNTLPTDVRNIENYTSLKLFLKEWAYDVTMLMV